MNYSRNVPVKERSVRWLLAGSLLCLAFAVPLALYAQQAGLPHVFEAGKPAKASEVNENFQNLHDRLATLEAAIAVQGGNVGIGTATPTAKLEVNGNIRLNRNDNDAIDLGVATFR